MAAEPHASVADQIDEGARLIEGTVLSIDDTTIVIDGSEEVVRYALLSTHDATGEVRLLLPGGQRGDLRVSYVGAPDAEVGEKVLVLGRLDADNVLRVITFGNSLFRSALDRDGAEIAVDQRGKPIVDLECDGSPALATSTEVASGEFTPLTWSALSETVRACALGGAR